MPTSTLKPYQIAPFEGSCKQPLAALFLGQGAGKTRLALLRTQTRKTLPALIICRPDDAKTWRDEIRDLEMDQSKFTITSFGKLRSQRHSSKIVLTSPNFQSIIVDQSESIKNPKSAQSKGSINLADRLRMKALIDNRPLDFAILTGCPTPQSKMEELWAQIRFLDGGLSLGTNYWKFLERFSYLVSTPFGLKPCWTPGTRQKVLEAISHLTFFIDNEEIYADLPPKVMKSVKLEVSREKLDAFMRIAKLFESQDGKDLNSSMEVQHVLRKTASGLGKNGKFEPAEKAKWILDAKRSDVFGRAVIFASFTDEIKMLANYLRCPYLIGSMPQRQREEIRDGFGKGAYRTIVCQVAMGIGINEFAAADAAIFTSLPWSNRLFTESVARIVRPDHGKRLPDKKELKIITLKAYPIDESIHRALIEHQSVNEWIRRKGWLLWKSNQNRGKE